jgi:hypothetical protein
MPDITDWAAMLLVYEQFHSKHFAHCKLRLYTDHMKSKAKTSLNKEKHSNTSRGWGEA